MKKIVCILTLFVLAAASQKLAAQVLYFDGLGRAVVSNDQLDGNIVQGDTTTESKATGGYTLFDLGVNIMPSETFRGRAVLRVRNEFGQFYGRGVALEFREMQLEGLIANGIYYNIGDVDIEMTPYTVFNTEEIYNTFEGDIFSMRRDILEYENFNHGNQWRVQGLKSEATLNFTQVFEKADLYGFAARTRPNDNSGTPDRLLTGIGINMTQSKNLQFGGNYVRFFDIPAEEADVKYINNVFTGTFRAGLVKDDYGIYLSGETGFSTYDFNKEVADTSVSFDDTFLDIGIEGEYKPLGIKGRIAFVDIGPQFSSPSAQSRRINGSATPELFGTVIDNTVNRQQTLLDRLGQEGLYSQSITPVLMDYLPQYNNALPYGKATPNRRGISAVVSKTDTSNLLTVEARLDLLSEIVGEGTTELRDFLVLRGGFSLGMDQLLGFERNFLLSIGVKYEKTTRDGLAAPVDLTSTLLDAGLTFEVVKDLELLAGYKYLNASGNEFLSVRDEFNGLISYTNTLLDTQEGILAVGAKYNFSETSFFALNGYFAGNQNKLNATRNYTLSQIYLYYTIWF